MIPVEALIKAANESDPGKSREVLVKELADKALRNNSVFDFTASLQELREIYKEDDLPGAEDLFFAAISDGISAISTNTVDTAQLRTAMRQLKANATVGALQTGAGLIQAISGIITKNGLQAPQLPSDYNKNPRLQTELSKAIYDSENADPELRNYFEGKVAESQAIQDSRSKVSGQAGQFVGNQQANARRSNSALIDFARLEEDNNRADESRVDRLIGEDIAEDKYIKDLEYRKFGAEESRYRAAGVSAQNQINSGLNNIFTGIGSLAGSLPDLEGVREQIEPIVDGRKVDPVPSIDREFVPLQSSNPVGVSRELPAISPTESFLSEAQSDSLRFNGPEFTNAELLLLGNESFRNDRRLMSRFRRRFNLPDFGQEFDQTDQSILDDMFKVDVTGDYLNLISGR